MTSSKAHEVFIEPLSDKPEVDGYVIRCSCSWITGAPTVEFAEYEKNLHLTEVVHRNGKGHHRS